MSSIVKTINYYNTFWNKRILNNPTSSATFAAWPALSWNPPGHPTFPNGMNIGGNEEQRRQDWFIEESRIVGGYNNTSVTYGVKAYANEENIVQEHRFNTLIYSGLFNSRTGVNRTNVFSIGESITRSSDPGFGPIQRTYADDNDLILLQEDKCSRALIDKDALYTAEGNASVTSTNLVIGQIVPFAGDFGIATNPESFARFGFRRYFSDSHRGSILRLSRDGLTEISKSGMGDFFRDELKKVSPNFKSFTFELETQDTAGSYSVITSTTSASAVELGMNVEVNNLSSSIYVIDVDYATNEITLSGDVFLTGGLDTVRFINNVKDQVLGGYDIFDRQYVISIQFAKTQLNNEPEYYTLTFDETVNGWNSFYTYKPSQLISLKDTFYTTNNGSLWKHYDETVINNRGCFYGDCSDSYVEFIFNDQPSTKKVFQTVSYEGDNGWEIDYFRSDFQQTDPDLPLSTPPTYTQNNSYLDIAKQVLSYDEGLYTDISGYPKRAGFDRKENLYVANLINNSETRPDEIIFGNKMSGIKGYFTRVKISTDVTTDTGGLKEIWSVGSKYVVSS